MTSFRSAVLRTTDGIKATVFVGTSLDGFIAREDGALDFLPQEPEDHGYDAFIATVDTVVTGRKTYETVLGFSSWPYGTRRVVVLSTSRLAQPPKPHQVEQLSGDPVDIVQRLAATGSRHLYVDGGITIQRFLRAGLIQRLIVTRVPVLIGNGIPLFGDLPRDIRLKHVATRDFPSGLVQSEYRVETA